MRNDRDAHMALCDTHEARQSLAADVSRVLARHAIQRVCVAPSRKALGFAPIVTLSLALIIGVLLALGV